MPARTPLPPGLGRAFTTAEARESGVARSRLRAADLDAPFHGARTRNSAPVPDPRVDARRVPDAHRRGGEEARILALADSYLPLMPEDAFFSHVTAAVLWRPPLPRSALDPREVEVSRFAPRRAPEGRRVRGHRVGPRFAERTQLGGVPVAEPSSVWASLAERLGVADLVALGDAVVHIDRRSQRALGTVDGLRATAEAGRRRGIRRLEAALELIRVGSASRAESLSRIMLLRAGLPEPDLDVEIRDRDDRLIGYADLGYRRFRIAIEYESRHHRDDDAQWNRDIDKYHEYEAAGWTVIRLTAWHVFRNPRAGERLVGAALMRAGWRP